MKNKYRRMIRIMRQILKESDMQSFQEMMLDDSSTMQEMIMSPMQDSDQMQMMEDMMKNMMNRMQDDPELKQTMMEYMDRMESSKLHFHKS